MTESAKRMINKTIKERHRNTWFILVHSNTATSKSFYTTVQDSPNKKLWL